MGGVGLMGGRILVSRGPHPCHPHLISNLCQSTCIKRQYEPRADPQRLESTNQREAPIHTQSQTHADKPTHAGWLGPPRRLTKCPQCRPKPCDWKITPLNIQFSLMSGKKNNGQLWLRCSLLCQPRVCAMFITKPQPPSLSNPISVRVLLPTPHTLFVMERQFWHPRESPSMPEVRWN